MNITLAKKIIEQLVSYGISNFFICPGGRSAPFVEILSKSKGLNLSYFYEERSAGFFALGRSKRDKKPSAVLTTSGTATAELLPSVIEAYYSAIPLVLITADRPLKFHSKACPQTLKNTTDIFKSYCSLSKNISNMKDLNLKSWNPSSSLHLNVCFDEPLIDKKTEAIDFSKIPKKKKITFPLKKKNFNKTQSGKINSFFKSCKKPLLLVGELSPLLAKEVKNILKDYENPIYAEAFSNLQGELSHLTSGEKTLLWALKNKHIDSLIRIGGRPRSRFWRDLEKNKIPVLNLSVAPHHEGLARPTLNQDLFFDKKYLKEQLFNLKNFGKDLKSYDYLQTKKYKMILKKYPNSEQAWILKIKKSLNFPAKIFLGNSLPIRLWDQVAFYKKKNLLEIGGQNGVNGIDGLVSRFLGECSSEKSNIGILGDLSLLYDISGFWPSKKQAPWTLIVVNNFGGQIFSRLFDNPAFLNSHNLSFKPVADLWSLNYKLYKKVQDFKWTKPCTLIEIHPSNKESHKLYQEQKALSHV